MDKLTPEQEAEQLYPYDMGEREIVLTFAEVIDYKRYAHVTAARMYMGEVERLKSENQGLKAEIENLTYHLDAMREQEKDMRSEFRKYQG